MLGFAALVVPTQARAAPPAPSTPAAFRLPPARAPLITEAPTLPGADFARRRTEAGLQAGVAHKLCWVDADACSNSAGSAFSFSVISRPSPFFGWGLKLARTSFDERLRFDDAELALEQTGLGLDLFGRVYPVSLGAFDPYLELGAGGGNVEARGSWSEARATTPIDESVLAPLLEAAFALDWHASTDLKFGARFGWTHWLLSPWEQCRGVAFGACTLPSDRHFDVANAVWSWQLTTAFLFGAPH